jgi:hypothetical protein
LIILVDRIDTIIVCGPTIDTTISYRGISQETADGPTNKQTKEGTNNDDNKTTKERTNETYYIA